MNKFQAAGWIATVIGMALIVFAIAYFTAMTVQNNKREDTKRITVCVSNGGTWVDYSDLCLQSGTKVVDGETH